MTRIVKPFRVRRAAQPLAALFGLVILVSIGAAVSDGATTRVQGVPGAASAGRVPAAEIGDDAAQRLAGAIRIATISPADPSALDGSAFQSLHRYLAAQFPRTHAALRREAVAEHSLLYTWKGSDSTLRPILLAGHLDVVPVERATEAKWSERPFAGTVKDGFVWGRGAIDNKSTIVGVLEAVELLLAEGYQPRRTIFLAFGHDEEVGGTRGAQEIAALLRSRGVKLEMVLDEGGVIGDGVLAGVAAPTALVGIAEKGFVSVELLVRTDGGHSSLPPKQSAIGILGAAVARLEDRQMPARLEGATAQLFQRIAPELPAARRVVFENLWATRPLVLRKLASSPTTNAMIRTTTAATIFQAGTKENVLATEARAVVNFRILPGDSIAGVLAHVRRAVDDPRVEVRRAASFVSEPSALSSTSSGSYRTIERTIRAVMPDAIVAPYLVVVITDSRFYADMTANIFRFLPIRLTSRDLTRIHGVDERIGVEEYRGVIRFYRQLVRDAASR